MPVLELTVDASGMERGSQQAQTALKGVQDAATKTQASVASVGGSFQRTFQVTQGGVQIATGIAQTAQAFQSLNAAAAGFAGARTLLEIGQTASQLAALQGGAAAASTAFALLGRAIPYVGLALSAGTALYAIFGDSVSSTTKKLNEQAAAFENLAAAAQKARIDESTRRFLGTAPGTSQDEMQRLYNVASLLIREGPGTATNPRTYSLADVQDFVGAPSRGGLATQFGVRVPPREVPGFENFDLGAVQIRQEDVLDWVRERYQNLAHPSQGNGPWEVEQARGMSRSWAAAEQANKEAIAQKQAEADRAHLAALERQVQLATQIGGAVGGALFDVLAGVQGIRQAAANLIAMFARQGLSNLGANLFGSTARQVTGLTSPGVGGGGGGGVEAGFGGLG